MDLKDRLPLVKKIKFQTRTSFLVRQMGIDFKMDYHIGIGEKDYITRCELVFLFSRREVVLK